MIKFKRITICMLSLVFCIILLGCADISLKSYTQINENGSGSLKLQVIYDDFISSALDKNIFEQQWAKENGFISNKYSKDNMNIEEITYEFNNLKDLEEKIKSSELVTMTYSKKTGIGKDTYNIDFKFNKSLMNELMKEKDDVKTGETDEMIYNHIKNIQVTNAIKVPGIIIKSNATGENNEGTKEWSYKLSQIDENTNINISYSIKNNLMIGVVGTAIIVLGGLGYIYFKKR